MYARVSTTQASPGNIDLALDIWRDTVLPAARQQPGFRGVYVIGDRASGKAYAITLWATEAALLQSASSGYLRHALGAFAPVLAGAPSQEILEVLLHEGA